MSEKPEALRWAAILEHQANHDGATDYKHKAAAELRSLHAENERLREALEKIATVNAMDYEYVRWAKAALRREY